MKNYNKTVLGIVVSLGLISGSVQASPFWHSARKWAARGAAVGYWGMLGYPSSQFLRSEIKAGWNGTSDFKKEHPEDYKTINEIAKKEGLKGFGNQRLRCMDCGVDAVRTVGNKIFIDDCYFVDMHDDGSLMAALLAREVVNKDEKSFEKTSAVYSGLPLVMHAAFSKKSAALHAVSGITRSLLRIPQAAMIMGASFIVGNWYSRKCEKRADESVKHSPALARALANDLQDEAQALNEVFENMWNEAIKKDPELVKKSGLSAEDAKKLAFSIMAPRMRFYSPSPLASDRIAYLNKWADKAEAKQKKA